MEEKKNCTDALEKLESIEEFETVLDKISVPAFNETIDLFSSNDHEKFCGKLAEYCKITISELYREVAEENIDSRKALVKRLKTVVNLIVIYSESLHRPRSLIRTVEMLHELLVPLDDTIPGAQFVDDTKFVIRNLNFVQVHFPLKVRFPKCANSGGAKTNQGLKI